jgi:alpha-D-ribose 1-methylphosphonate 5-triphosphate diphosphatase
MTEGSMRIFTGATVITEDEVLEGCDVAVEGDRIVATGPRGTLRETGSEPTDLSGCYLMPGLMDIHADYLERMVAPRPTTIIDFGLALRFAERELVAHGITTMFHSLSFYAGPEFVPSAARRPEHTAGLIAVIGAASGKEHIIRHRLHARFETDSVTRLDELKAYIAEGKVDLLSFMDHSPGQGQYRDLDILRKTLRGYNAKSDEEAELMMRDSLTRPRLGPEELGELSRFARDRGIAVASHDDDSPGKVARAASIGGTISEFPISLETARAARAAGMHAVAGAPNVVLGGSHSGNISAAEAILDGSVDVLCSDYYPPALLNSVFVMAFRYGLGLSAAVRLATLNPAAAVNADADYGSIAVGKKADLIAVRLMADGFPAVALAVVDGESVFVSSYRREQNEKTVA